MNMKEAFNKYNAPELLSQLISVLDNEGLDDAVNQIRMKKIPQVVDKAWKSRGKVAAVDEKLMDRAAQILQYENERDAIKRLVREGVGKQDAYFAVKAGKLLNKSRMKMRVASRYLAGQA